MPDSFMGPGDDIKAQVLLIWDMIKVPLVIPLLRVAVVVCLMVSLMLFCERVYMSIVIVLVKLFGRKPDKRYKFEPFKDDVESGNSDYPHVLIQIPMFNEREVHKFCLGLDNVCFKCQGYVMVLFSMVMQVYKMSIGAACKLSWPSDRIVIQVLDDSTDHTVKVKGENVKKF